MSDPQGRELSNGCLVHIDESLDISSCLGQLRLHHLQFCFDQNGVLFPHLAFGG